MKLHDIRVRPDVPEFWFRTMQYLLDVHAFGRRFQFYRTPKKQALRLRIIDDTYRWSMLPTEARWYADYYKRPPMNPDDPLIDWSQV